MINIYKVNNSKFKSIYLSINFSMQVDTKQIAYNSVISSILSKSSIKYSTQQQMEEYLYSLYGANFDINVELYGDIYNIEFKIEFVNKEFLPNKEDVLDDILCFLYDVIYNPVISKDKVDTELLNREKNFIIDKIKARKDDKIRYAISRTEQIMCEGEPFSASVYGFEEEVEKIDEKEIYNRYLNIINNSCITMYISGNLNGYENIDQDIKSIFRQKLDSKLKYIDLNTDTKENKNKISKIQEVEEKQDTTQSVITFGIRLKNADLEDYYLLNVYNAVLGGTPSSKLFQIFREKESLAYTVRSRYYRFKNMMIIFAGIEKKNYARAKEVVFKILEDIKNINITDEEFNASKQSLISDILEWDDSKVALAKIHMSNLLANKGEGISIQDMLQKIKNINKEDFKKLSDKFYIEKIYLLGGEENA